MVACLWQVSFCPALFVAAPGHEESISAQKTSPLGGGSGAGGEEKVVRKLCIVVIPCILEVGDGVN